MSWFKVNMKNVIILVALFTASFAVNAITSFLSPPLLTRLGMYMYWKEFLSVYGALVAAVVVSLVGWSRLSKQESFKRPVIRAQVAVMVILFILGIANFVFYGLGPDRTLQLIQSVL